MQVGSVATAPRKGRRTRRQELQLLAETQVQVYAVSRTLERLSREFNELGDEMAERLAEEEQHG